MRNDRMTSAFLFAFDIFVCIEASHLEMGYLHNPGPGFIHFLAGSCWDVFP